MWPAKLANKEIAFLGNFYMSAEKLKLFASFLEKF
jgi:hypothetical protein